MSDHKDAHLAIEHPECDIGDLWAYHWYPDEDKDPHTARVVFVMTLNAGEVGMIWHGPRTNRNADLYTTVPKRFLDHVPYKKRVHADGLRARGDIRRRLTGRLRFHPDAVYEFRIAKPDADGNDRLRPTTSFKVVFDGEGGIPDGKRRPLEQTMELLKAEDGRGDHVERGDRSGKEIVFDANPRAYTAADDQDPNSVKGFTAPTPHGPIRLYAGPRQDPFTFDFEGVRTLTALQYRKELCGGTPSGGSSDAFSRAFNISAIVLEVPIQEILTEEEIEAGMTFGVWSATTLDGHPINRAGWPLYKPTFLPKKDFYGILDPTNGTKLESQTDVLTPLVTESLTRLDVRGSVKSELLGMVIPDALPIDVSKDAGLTQPKGPNGRTLDETGDPAKFFIEKIDPYAYRGRRKAPGKRPQKLKMLDDFPYLTAPSARPGSRGSSGWTDFTPIPDPPWPTRTRNWEHPDSCDDYQDGLLDPTLRQAGPRP